MEIHLVDLPLDRPGFRKFVSSWLLRDGDRTYLVDTGPMSSYPILKRAVEILGGGRVDAVLLTHVHLDHGGAAGLLAREYAAPVAAPGKGIAHLLDPEALWKGSLATLGETALIYGKPVPVPEDRILPQGGLPPGFSSVDSPGHAPHHQCFVCEEAGQRILFSGEAAGVFLEGVTPFPYLRPATPPRFFPEVTLESIRKLSGLGCSRICYGHFGAADRAGEMLRLAGEQILFWKGQIRSLLARGIRPVEEGKFLSCLLEEDPLLEGFASLEPDIRERERIFLGNSIRGFLDAFAAGRA